MCSIPEIIHPWCVIECYRELFLETAADSDSGIDNSHYSQDKHTGSDGEPAQWQDIFRLGVGEVVYDIADAQHEESDDDEQDAQSAYFIEHKFLL